MEQERGGRGNCGGYLKKKEKKISQKLTIFCQIIIEIQHSYPIFAQFIMQIIKNYYLHCDLLNE